ncbi:hypothetical protein [Nocardioides sp. cx-173]|uniref:hypothetical protein n=1 Tax=Nocardioides sp. cx-173 TaxID=2898796 RepID=UPI001E2ADE35|nr:hypothetical protein [Nocardioides sp. cx-173]MCD4523655.1 hypothetical protein [Nocardioides sp. cx-173]UGB42012.1 hypothetical protein LQ940_00410 [Nocardioides sp. cx-173]
MSFLRLLTAVLARTAVLTLGYVAFAEVLSHSDSTDALGAGLLFFLLVLVLVLVWSAYDGLRRGVGAALLTWALTAAASGASLVAAYVLRESGDLGAELRDSWLFFALLVAVPAVPGAAVGAVVRRARRHRATA